MFSIPDHVSKLPMTGTEAQSKWARSIRLDKARMLQTCGVAGMTKKFIHLVQDGNMEEIGALTQSALVQFVALTAIEALSSDNHRWWIDHRNDDPGTWLPDAYVKCLDKCRMARPKWKE